MRYYSKMWPVDPIFLGALVAALIVGLLFNKQGK